MQQTEWVETQFDGDPIAAIKLIMSSKSSGQAILNVSQGTVCKVIWREKKAAVSKQAPEVVNRS